MTRMRGPLLGVAACAACVLAAGVLAPLPPSATAAPAPSRGPSPGPSPGPSQAPSWQATNVGTAANTFLCAADVLPDGRVAAVTQTIRNVRTGASTLLLRIGSRTTTLAHTRGNGPGCAMAHDPAGHLLVIWETGGDRAVRTWTAARGTRLLIRGELGELAFAAAPDGHAALCFVTPAIRN